MPRHRYLLFEQAANLNQLSFFINYRFLSMLILIMSWSFSASAQNGLRFSEDLVVRDGFHITPVMMSTKGYSFGIGYAKPIRSKLMFHITAGYIPYSYLNGEETRAVGVSLHPAVLFFPDRVDNFKGVVMGIEMPIMFYNMRRHDWISRTSTGEETTFVYSEYQLTNAKALQTGLGAKFGFRTHRRNQPLFWQPTFTIGALYQKLFNYTEAEPQFNDFEPLGNVYTRQNTGVTLYVKFEVCIGLYRFKKEKIKVLEI